MWLKTFTYYIMNFVELFHFMLWFVGCATILKTLCHLVRFSDTHTRRIWKMETGELKNLST